MNNLLCYECSGPVATIRIDDGKVNTMSIAMLEALHAALDQAEQDRAAVLIVGREGVFSSGFDLRVFAQGPEQVLKMLTLGADLSLRLLSSPSPIVIACGGHALPMGAFLLMTADARVGARGAYQIGLNEVAIDLTLPLFAVEIARHRLTTPAFHRSTLTATMYTPEEALEAGFLDQLVEASELESAARILAERYAGYSRPAFVNTKLRVRHDAIAGIKRAMSGELTLDNVRLAMGDKRL